MKNQGSSFESQQLGETYEHRSPPSRHARMKVYCSLVTVPPFANRLKPGLDKLRVPARNSVGRADKKAGAYLAPLRLWGQDCCIEDENLVAAQAEWHGPDQRP